jgi:hypothetical protein
VGEFDGDALRLPVEVGDVEIVLDGELVMVGVPVEVLEAVGVCDADKVDVGVTLAVLVCVESAVDVASTVALAAFDGLDVAVGAAVPLSAADARGVIVARGVSLAGADATGDAVAKLLGENPAVVEPDGRRDDEAATVALAATLDDAESVMSALALF